MIFPSQGLNAGGGEEADFYSTIIAYEGLTEILSVTYAYVWEILIKFLNFLRVNVVMENSLSIQEP